MIVSTVRLLAPQNPAFPEAWNLTASFINLHVSELAHFSETPSLFPKGAHCLIANGGFTVSKGTTVALGTPGIEEEIAVLL